MFEISIWNTYRMKVLYSYVHVKTSLDIILWYSLFFEILSCSAKRVRQCFILLRDPTSLNSSFLFLVTFFFLIFAKQSCNRLNCLLWINLTVVACGLLRSAELRLGSIPQRSVFLSWEFALILCDIISEFLNCRMLR